MPLYEYQCNKCRATKEIEHGMLLQNELPPKIIKEITCHGITMNRVFSVPTINTSDTRALLMKKQKSRKERSAMHFKKEVLPNLNETPKITKYFEDKHKDIKIKNRNIPK